MLSRAFEFVRIADPNPGDEKVRTRKEAAASLLEELVKNRDLLLSALQGVVFGFDKAPLNQDSPVVRSVLKAVKGPDTAFPEDLTENAMELRAVAAIAIGEILMHSATQEVNSSPVLVALCLQSALALRTQEKNQHLRAMLEHLANAAAAVSASEALKRRQRSHVSMKEFGALTSARAAEDGEEEERSLDDVLPVIHSAFEELQRNTAKDREELEILWWLFAAYSETEQKPLQGLSAAAAAFCSGLELAEKSLLPPSGSTQAMVRRALQSSHPSDAAKGVKLEAAIKDWTRPMMDGLLTPQDPAKSDPELYPALLPLSWACQRTPKDGATPQLDKNFTKFTGIDKKREAIPADWGTQIFLEKSLLRLLARRES